jgi:hypothetical protein
MCNNLFVYSLVILWNNIYVTSSMSSNHHVGWVNNPATYVPLTKPLLLQALFCLEKMFEYHAFYFFMVSKFSVKAKNFLFLVKKGFWSFMMR